MKPLILLVGLVFFSCNTLFSQEILGKLKLQDAEMSMKASKWEEALEHIKEAEKFFTKPQSAAVWMKIQIFDKQLDQQQTWKTWQLLKAQFSVFETQLKDDERWTQVQKLQEKYKGYPAVESEWASFMNKGAATASTTNTTGNTASENRAGSTTTNNSGSGSTSTTSNSSGAKATVYFMRSTGFGGSANPFTLFVNNQFVSMLSNKRYVQQDLPAGEHFFASQVDGKTLKERTVSHSYVLEAGKTYYLKVYFIPDKGLRVQVVFLKVNDAEGQKMLAELKEQK